MPIDYKKKMTKEQVRVTLRNETGRLADLPTRLADFGREYGFELSTADKNHETVQRRFECSHLIWICEWNDWSYVRGRLISEGNAFSSVSIALCYRNDLEFRQSSVIIENEKRAFGDTVNFLMPVRYSDGSWQVPDYKILDNSVCDTVRVKFDVKQLSEDVPVITDDEANFFTAARHTFNLYPLHFRAPTDGYVAVRCGLDNQFLITATKTNKQTFTMDRVSKVIHYDRQLNQVTYSGLYLPSSDSIEAAIIFQSCPTVTSIVHSHASRLFTRNASYASRVLVPQLPYGSSTLGDAIARAITTTSPDWLIMEEHGELFFGSARVCSLAVLKAACEEALRSESEFRCA